MGVTGGTSYSHRLCVPLTRNEEIDILAMAKLSDQDCRGLPPGAAVGSSPCHSDECNDITVVDVVNGKLKVEVERHLPRHNRASLNPADLAYNSSSSIGMGCIVGCMSVYDRGMTVWKSNKVGGLQPDGRSRFFQKETEVFNHSELFTRIQPGIYLSAGLGLPDSLHFMPPPPNKNTPTISASLIPETKQILGGLDGTIVGITEPPNDLLAIVVAEPARTNLGSACVSHYIGGMARSLASAPFYGTETPILFLTYFLHYTVAAALSDMLGRISRRDSNLLGTVMYGPICKIVLTHTRLRFGAGAKAIIKRLYPSFEEVNPKYAHFKDTVLSL